jgi:hypothetical protein
VVEDLRTWHEEVEVSAIVLNPGNYRHRAVQSQEECFVALFTEDKRDQMLALATDIASEGLDPSDLPILQPIDGYFRVVEGNRRFACIKAMENPSLIPDIDGLTPAAMSSYRKSFEGLGQATELPTAVLCTVSTDQDAINHWIGLRHLPVGSHKGAGRMLWDTEGRVRMEQALAGPGGGRSAATNTQTADALAVFDGLTLHFPEDDELHDLIERAKKNKLTTIGRLLVNPENHVLLGIRIEDDGVRFLVGRDALRTVWHRVLNDAVSDTLTARRINKADDVKDYVIREINDDLPTAADRTSAPINPATQEATIPTKKAVAKRAKVAASERKPYRGLRLRHASEKTKQVLAEMQKLTFDASPYILAALNRTLIDLFTWDAMAQIQPAKNVASPSARMHKVMALIEPANTKPKDRKFPLIVNAMEKDIGDLAIDTMNGYMHRANWHPTPDIVRRQAEQYGPFLKELDDIIEAHLLTQQLGP